MLPEFEEAAFSQEVGVNGSVLKTEEGYHIVQVTARHTASTTPLTELSEDIGKHLSSKAKQEKFGEFLKGLRDSAKITYAEK